MCGASKRETPRKFFRRSLLPDLRNSIGAEGVLRSKQLACLGGVHVLGVHAGLLSGRKVIRVLHRLLEGVGIEIDDLLRSALGSDDAAGAAVPLIVVAEFTEGGGVGIFFKALGIKDAEDLDLALEGGEVRDLCNREVNLSLAQRKKLVGGAAVRMAEYSNSAVLAKSCAPMWLEACAPLVEAFSSPGCSLA